MPRDAATSTVFSNLTSDSLLVSLTVQRVGPLAQTPSTAGDPKTPWPRGWPKTQWHLAVVVGNLTELPFLQNLKDLRAQPGSERRVTHSVTA